MGREFQADYFVGDTISAAFSVTFVAVLGAQRSPRSLRRRCPLTRRDRREHHLRAHRRHHDGHRHGPEPGGAWCRAGERRRRNLRRRARHRRAGENRAQVSAPVHRSSAAVPNGRGRFAASAAVPSTVWPVWFARWAPWCSPWSPCRCSRTPPCALWPPSCSRSQSVRDRRGPIR
jgi:hypothetical protein